MDSLSKKLEPKENTIKPYLVYAQSLSSIAPLGSVSAYLTYAFSSSLSSTFLAGIIGVLIYFLWVLIGYRYSKVIATTGGIYDFARSGGGELIGKIAGWLYWISYAVYLSSATTYLSGIVIPTVFNVNPMLLEIVIPLALTLLILSGVKPPLFYALITSSIEVVLIIILGVKVLSSTGLSLWEPLTVNVSFSSFFSGALAVGFTLAGGGASFFLGYEAEGKGKTVGKAYILAYWVASLSVLFAAYFETAAVGYSNEGVLELLNTTQYPGYYIAEKYVNPTFGLIIFIFTANSLIGSVTAAYLALSRLTYSLLKKYMLTSVLVVASLFIGINLIASITQQYLIVYTLTTVSSLVTLYSSHLLVSSVFPPFTKKVIRLKWYDFALALSTVLLMGYGLWSNLNQISLVTEIGIISLSIGVIIGIIHWWWYKRLR
ncbi:MAG: APC family permease [Sulfolobus sp.]